MSHRDGGDACVHQNLVLVSLPGVTSTRVGVEVDLLTVCLSRLGGEANFPAPEDAPSGHTRRVELGRHSVPETISIGLDRRVRSQCFGGERASVCVSQS